ncbi:MAG: GNAT family N-acetyltransferase [Maribacter sp.]
MIKIIKGSKGNLDQIVPLFDQYRIFYQQKSDKEAARAFLKERIDNDESILFLAYYDNQPVGFTQLYPQFSSVSMKSSYVLNDLFVDASFRQKQIGEALLNHAKAFCIENNGKGLTLETAIDNPAQNLYEKLGWKKDVDCFHYFWTVN